MKARTLLLYVATLALVLPGCKKQQPQNTELKAFAVASVVTEKADIGVFYPASLRGKQDIEIRPRVSGYITKLCIDEGSAVKKGQELFRIDDVTYREAERAAIATVSALEANVASNRLIVTNKKRLAERNVISDVELQASEYALAAIEAQLAQAKAQLVSARNDLSYTSVKSPSDGIVGSIPYRVGSLASSTMAVPMTIVSDISEIYAHFAVNEKELLNYTRNASNIDETVKNMPKVNLILADGSQYPAEGNIETISGVIDQKTGAVTLRARFENSGKVLRSGGSGNIRFQNQVEEAIYIPQKATYELQNKRFIYTLTDSMTVKSAAIETIDTGDGQRYIVTSGLSVGQKIVTEGVASLREGMKIAVKQ